MSKKEEIQNRMMDYLFDEMDDQEKEAFEAMLREQPDLQKELDELRMTRDLMNTYPSAVPPFQPELNRKTESKTLQTKNGHILNLPPFVRNLAAIAASLLIVALGITLAGVEAGSTENGFYVTIGNPPVQSVDTVTPDADPDLTEERVVVILEQMQSEQAILFAGLMEEFQSQQGEQVHEMLAILTDYYEDRRQQDLKMIAEGLNQLEYDTQTRFNRTNTTLGNLIYALSNP